MYQSHLVFFRWMWKLLEKSFVPSFLLSIFSPPLFSPPSGPSYVPDNTLRRRRMGARLPNFRPRVTENQFDPGAA